MNTDQHTSIDKRAGRRQLMAAATLAVAAFAAPAQAQDTGQGGQGKTAVQLLKRGLDTFLAKDMKGWADLCDENVVAEWSVSGRVISNGNPYELSYATVVTFRNGLMVNYREYWNPQAFTAAMAGARF